jgi:hypothetical protein
MPVPQWLYANPYRILRLSASASLRDAHEAASSMRRLAILAIADASAADIPSLGDVPRTESDIRAALGRLENPSHRIADRLFWLHSRSETSDANGSENPEAPLTKSAFDHDRALEALFRLYPSESVADGPSTWTEALHSWRICVDSDDYWKLTLVLERLGSFEPQASVDEIRLLRDNAMLMASDPLLMIARQAVANDECSGTLW